MSRAGSNQETGGRRVFAYALPEEIREGALRGGCAVIIDLLRASTTITHALRAGAVRVIPALEVGDAWRMRAEVQPEEVVLGGERGGVRIEGFDLGNSPTEYTRARVGGKTVVFTTTNGTRAALACRDAARVVVGCFANISAVERSIAGAERVHLVCAGTGGARTEEDELFAGALGARLVARGFEAGNSTARDVIRRWRSLADDPVAVLGAVRESCGGRNLAALGMDADVVECARADTCGVVPEMTSRGLVLFES